MGMGIFIILCVEEERNLHNLFLQDPNLMTHIRTVST